MTLPGSRCFVGAAFSFTAAVVLSGCAVARQVFASPGDLDDYRRFRMAVQEGRRLYEAQRYLTRHPAGVWANEVRAVFEVEEPAWFERAKASRAGARDYVVEVPNGPHVAIARRLMVLFDEQQDDVEAFEFMTAVRKTAAAMDYESARRRHVSDLLLGEVGALADSDSWRIPLESRPPVLTAALVGDSPPTWGGQIRPERDDALFYVIPTPEGPQARVIEVTFRVSTDRGKMARGVVRGADLFVRWAEVLLLRVLDAGAKDDRRLAASTVADVLGGAFEASMPGARCNRPVPSAVSPEAGTDREVMARACAGRILSVRMGSDPGTDDVIEVRTGQLDGAPAPGMR